MVGIYKLVSPSGKVYIGQSLNIEGRISKYKRLACKNQRKLYSSLVKYGFENHLFEVIHELPFDVEISVLNHFEEYYWGRYVECGFEMLNLVQPGNNARHSEESKKKISESLMGDRNPMWGKKHTEESKRKMSVSQLKRFNQELPE